MRALSSFVVRCFPLLLLLPMAFAVASEAATAEDIAVLKAALAPDCADKDPQYTVLTARFITVMPNAPKSNTPFGQAYLNALYRNPLDSKQELWPQALRTALTCPALRVLDPATIEAAQAKQARDRSHPFVGGNGMVLIVTLPGYSSNGELAVVQRTVSCGNSCGGMWTLWLNKTAQGWRISRKLDGGM